MAYSATQLQLTHVLQRLYRRLGGSVVLATGGSTSTVIDTNIAVLLEDANEDDIYNNGTVIVVEDGGGANAAPEGEFSRISDYASSSTTVTFSPVMTAAIASGDKVMIVDSTFPLYDMVEVVNDALANIGYIPVVDSSLTTAANQTEYALPIALKGRQLINIEIETVTTDANDPRYIPVDTWDIIDADPGSTGLLVLPQFASGYTLRITYMGKHPRVSAYDDYISEYLQPDLVHAAVLAHAVQWKNDTNKLSGGDDPALVALEQKAWSQYDRARISHPMPRIPRRIKGGPRWRTTRTDDEFYPIPTS